MRRGCRALRKRDGRRDAHWFRSRSRRAARSADSVRPCSSSARDARVRTRSRQLRRPFGRAPGRSKGGD